VGSPLYCAVNEWLPVVENPCVNAAVPELSSAVPSTVVPSRKVICPVAEAGVMAAVRTTVFPAFTLLDGALRETLDGVEPCGPTLIVTSFEVLPA
jgi:hypothetical protein